MRFALVCFVAVVIQGCGPKEPENWSKFDVAPVPAASGWTRVVNAAAGITIDLPPDWAEDDGGPEHRDRLMAAFKEVDPQFDGFTSQILRQPEDFISAIDLNRDGLKSGVVQQVDGGVQKLDASLDLADIRKLRLERPRYQGPSPVLMEEIQIPIGTALHIVDDETVDNLIGGGHSPMKAHRFYFGRERTMWVVKFLIRIDDKAAETAMMDSVKSIRITAPNFELMKQAYDAQNKRLAEARDKRSKDDQEEANTREEEKARQREREIEEEERLRKEREQQQQQSPAQDPGQDPPSQEPPAQDPPAQSPPQNGDASGG